MTMRTKTAADLFCEWPTSRVETVDRPFALPNRELISTVVDLPFPVSTNRIWAHSKGGGVRKSAEYIKWTAEADRLGMSQRINRSKCIEGPFRVELWLRDGRRMDADNAIKCVLDLAQRWNLIANDRYCRELTVKWVRSDQAVHGARLTLVELVS